MITFTPKERFQKSSAIKFHVELVTKSEVHYALEVALAEMVRELGQANDLATAASFHYRLAGAKQFMNIWLNLAEPKEVRAREDKQNLNRPD